VPFQDFREFLDALRKQGELFDVDRPVALELEVAKALRKSAAVAGPAFCLQEQRHALSAGGRRLQLARQGADRAAGHRGNRGRAHPGGLVEADSAGRH
jgi:hypothetical protein